MGEESTKNNGKPSTESKQGTDNATGGNTGHSTPTKSTGGTGGGRGGATGGTAEAKQSEKPVGLPVLSEPPKDVSVKLPEGAKPATKKKKKKPVPAKVDTKAVAINDTSKKLSLLLLAVSEIGAVRLGDVWRLTEGEADSVASPLTNIFAKYGLLEGITENSDWLALLTALGMIAVPRVLLAKQIKKSRTIQEVPVHYVQTKESKPESPKDGAISPAAPKQPASSGTPDARQFFTGFEPTIY